MKTVKSIATGLSFFYVAVTSLIAYTQMDLVAIWFFGFWFFAVGYAIGESGEIWKKIFFTKRERFQMEFRDKLLKVILESESLKKC